MMQHLSFTSPRLQMTLITRKHATEIYPMWQDPAMFTYLPADPPTLEKLQRQYTFWEGREAPDGSEYWLNYVVYLHESQTDKPTCIGTLQAGVHRETGEASIAYMIGTAFQGQGLGTEATRALLTHLQRQYAVHKVKAWIDTRNQASIQLVKKLGMCQVELLRDADHFKGATSDEFVFQIDF